jgi:hypothetical protein
MAKGETKIQYSQPPSMGATTREAIEAEVAMMPQRYETELAYRPKFTQVDIEALRQYAPAVLGLQQESARGEKALQEELYPEAMAGERKLGTTMAGADLTGGFSPEEEAYYKDQFRSEEAVAGRLGSPVASLNIANKLASMKEQRRAQRMGEILSYTGRTPVVGSQQFQPQVSAGQPTLTGQFMGSQLGYAQTAYAPKAIRQRQGMPWETFGQLVGGGMQAGGTLGAAAIMASALKIKYNVKEIKSALKKIKKIKGRLFNWKYSGMQDGGVIAEEIEQVIPESVIKVNGIKMIKPMMIIAYLIEAIKELDSSRRSICLT